MEYAVNFFGKRFMRRRYLVQLKSPYKQNFRADSAFVWISSLVIGYEFLDTSRMVKRYGRHSVYTYFLAGFMQIIPLWSYLELTSVIATSGGLYHYVYGVSNELMAFLTGWLQILGVMSYLATIADKLVNELDSVFFDGTVGIGLEKYLSVDVSYDVDTYINNYPHILRLFVIMAVAALSTAIETAKFIDSMVCYLMICSICCLIITFAADSNWDYFVVPNFKCISTFFAGYYDISNMFTKVYCLIYLGGEFKQAEKYIPRVMLLEFIFAWIAFTILPVLLTLPLDIQYTHAVWVISSILEQAGGYNLYRLLDAIATSLELCGLLVYFVSLSRIVVAMARDGLLFQIFSRVESVTQYPVKPNLLLGIITGFMAMVFDKDFLERIGKVTENLLACLAPVCVMLLRYTDAPSYLVKHKHVKATTIEPVENVGLAVWAIVGSTVAISCIISEWTAKYLINEKYPTSEHPYRLAFAGLIFIISAGFLIYQKQNVLKTPFRVPLVPFVPVISIFLQSFMFPVIPINCVAAIAAWTILGLLFYLLYGMKHSREHLL